MPDWAAPHPIDCRHDHRALRAREECVGCGWCPEDAHVQETRIVGPGQLISMCSCHWMGDIREGDAARALANVDGEGHAATLPARRR